MGVKDHFTIPFIGLKKGLHHLKFEVNNQFFSLFENSIVSEGKFDILLTLDKGERMSEMDFDITGYIVTDCDRCMELIHLPITTRQRLLVKYSEESIEGNDEVIYIHPSTSQFNVAQHIYEYIHLAIPLIKTYDCESDPNANCNQEILEQFDVENDDDRPNTIWDTLKDLNLDQ